MDVMRWPATIVVGVLCGMLCGCADFGSVEKESETVQIDGAQFLLESEPEGAQDVIQVRSDAKDSDEVIVTGRIGGSRDPWVADHAAFWIVDHSLKACSDIPGDTCRYPWDYCCETPRLPESMALIKVVDDAGQMVMADARQLLDVKELSTVVVKGKAERDEEGNLTVVTSSVYVKR